eukprot:gene12559-8979_t
MAENVQQLREQQKEVVRQQETSVAEVLVQWNDHDVSLKSALDQIAAEVQNVAEEAQSQLEAGRENLVTVRTERNRYLQAAKELEAELEEQALAMLAEETVKPAAVSRTASNDAKDATAAVPIASSAQPSSASSTAVQDVTPSASALPPSHQRSPNKEPVDAVVTQAALGEMLLRAGSSGDAGASLSLTAATSTSATAATASQWELQLRLAEEKIAALAAEKKQLEQRVKTQQKDFDGQHRAKWRLIQELEAKNTELDRLVVQLSSSSSQSQSQSQSQHQQQVLQQSVAGHQRDVSPSSPGDDRSDDQHTLNGSRDELSHLLFSPPPPQPPQPQQQQQRRPSSVTSSGTATVARPKSTQSFAQQTSFHSLQQQQQTTTTATSVSRRGSRSQLTAVPSAAHVAVDATSDPPPRHTVSFRDPAGSAARAALGEYEYETGEGDEEEDVHVVASLDDFHVEMASASASASSMRRNSSRIGSATGGGDGGNDAAAGSVEELLLGGGGSRRADRPPRPPSSASSSRLSTTVGGHGDGSHESKSGHDQDHDGIDLAAAVDELRQMLHDVETQKEALVVQLRDLEHEREHWQLATTTSQQEQRNLRKENDDLAKDNLRLKRELDLYRTKIFTVVSKEGSSLVHGLPDVNISFQSRSMAASAAAVAAEYDYLSPSTSTSQALYIINQLVHNNNDLVERNATLERDKKRLDVALTDKDQQLRQRLLELQEKDAAVAKMKQLLTQANATITATVEDYRVLQEQVATLTAKLKEQSLENTHLKALLSPQKRSKAIGAANQLLLAKAAAPRAPSPTWSTVFGHTSPRASPSSSPSPSPGSFLANSSVHGAAARSGYYHGSGPSAGRAPAAYLLSQSLQESLSSPPPYTRDSRQTAASLLAAAASSSTTLSTSATTAALSKPTVTLRQDVEARLQEYARRHPTSNTASALAAQQQLHQQPHHQQYSPQPPPPPPPLMTAASPATAFPR